MDYPQEQYNEIAEQLGVHNQSQQSSLLAGQNNQMQYQMEEQEKNLAESQLDVEETLIKIDHLLRQDVIKVNDQGIREWNKISDEKKRVLTNEGVEKIMVVLQFYINKETLLSNFDDKMIARRMLDFSYSLSALIFLKYETFFSSPSLKECKEILQLRINNKVESKKLNAEIFHKEFDAVEEEKKILKELEGRLDYEIEKIKQEQTKTNLREFEMIFTQITALVESTHNRAWKGEERGSLRRHFNISEVIGGKGQMPEKKGGIFGWGRS